MTRRLLNTDTALQRTPPRNRDTCGRVWPTAPGTPAPGTPAPGSESPEKESLVDSPSHTPVDSPSHIPIVFGSLLPEDFEIDPEDMVGPDSPLKESSPPVCARDKVSDTIPCASDQSGDWEWQCPDGHQLEPYVVPAGAERMQCSSCRQWQHPGKSVF